MISKRRHQTPVGGSTLTRKIVQRRLLALRQELRAKIIALEQKQATLERARGKDDEVENDLLFLQRRMKRVGWKILLLERTSAEVYDGMTCLECHQPISQHWLEKSPEARFCTACFRIYEDRLVYKVKLGDLSFRMNLAIAA